MSLASNDRLVWDGLVCVAGQNSLAPVIDSANTRPTVVCLPVGLELEAEIKVLRFPPLSLMAIVGNASRKAIQEPGLLKTTRPVGRWNSGTGVQSSCGGHIAKRS